MAVDTKIELVGVEDAIKALRRIDPELRKQFNRDAREIAKPAVDQAKTDYPVIPLSGFARKWKEILPWDINRVRRSVRVKIDTSRKSTNVIYLQQADRGAAVFESAGRKSPNALSEALGPLGAFQTRVLGPALAKQEGAVERGFEKLARDTMATVQKELR